jgi:hypothetical protein
VSRRVLIKTLPLHSNYGGILQAYALQEAIRRLGFDAVTDTSTPHPLSHRVRRRYWAARRAVRMLVPARYDWTWRAPREVLADQAGFARRHLRAGTYVERAATPRARARLASKFQAFVVGSDQVWRSAYAEIPDQFLDVIEEADGDRPRRVSYAASFGLDDVSEYSAAEFARAASLIRRFHAISVREDAGVRICRDEFGVAAQRHLDPTLLLDAEHYLALASRAEPAPAPGDRRLLVYQLDPNDELRAIEVVIADRLGLELQDLLTSPPPETYAEYAADRAAYDRPSVERWLSSFASAEFVVTDSYHGCVFAILFNRPFVVLANPRRGASRFETLLDVFGLRHHVVSTVEAGIDERVFAPDWHRVNRILDAERARSAEYLTSVL